MMKHVIFLADMFYGMAFWQRLFAVGRQEDNLDICVLALSDYHKKIYHETGFYDEVVGAQGWLEAYPQNPASPEQDIIRQIEAFEERYDCLIGDIIHADRHLGRSGFYLGFEFPRSGMSDNAAYWSTAEYILFLAEKLEELYEARQADTLVVRGIASLFTKLMCVIARRRGMRVRILNSARIGNRYTWFHSEYFQQPDIKDRYRELVSSQSQKPGALREGDRAVAMELNKNSQKQRIRFKKMTGLSNMAVQIKNVIFGTVRENIADRVKGRNPNPPMRYHLKDRISLYYRIWRDYRQLDRIHARQNIALPQKYAFYTMHVEPEMSLMVLAPEFNNQLAIIDLVAKSLPGGMILIVKEHMTGLGRRPCSFYKWLNDIPNVYIAHPDSKAPEIAGNAEFVVTITGTVGLEAALDGVSVVTFGKHNLYNPLDHVHIVDGAGKLRKLFKKLEAENTTDDRDMRRCKAAFLIEAITDNSVEIIDMADQKKGLFSTQSDKVTEDLYHLLAGRLHETQGADQVVG